MFRRFLLNFLRHEHSQYVKGMDCLLKTVVCSKCGHLLLSGHVDNKRVEVIDRSGGCTIQGCEIYSKSCAPSWDIKEIGLDGRIRYFKRIDNKLVEVVD